MSAARAPTTDGRARRVRRRPPAIDSPLFTYAHTDNATLVTGNAIVGGAFYRPATVHVPVELGGDYFFGDYVAGWVNRLDVRTATRCTPSRGWSYLTDIQVGPDGALYVLADVELGGVSVQRP